eukprot:1188735-Prorocentrum_minimum.AAC.3
MQSNNSYRRRLALVLVGLPARGKTFTAQKLSRRVAPDTARTLVVIVNLLTSPDTGCRQSTDQPGHWLSSIY